MKLFVQWALAAAAGWEQLDSADFQDMPKKGMPDALSLIDTTRGWINALNVQGVEFIGYDHYAVESLADGACRVTVWKDDPDDLPTDVLGEFYARQWTFQRLAPDARLGGAWSTRQLQVCYAGPKLTQFYADNPSELTVLPWADFVPPPEQFVRHGVWLPDALMEASNPLRMLKDWREWTDGVPLEQIEGGKLREQRTQGLYDKPKGTKTYGLRNIDQATSALTATHENQMTRDAFGAGETETSNALAGGGQEFSHFWATVSGEPDSADFPSGIYRCSMNITSVGGDISYGLRTSGTATGQFLRMNSDLSSGLESATQIEALFTGTGIKVATTGTIDPAAGSATDRFSGLLAISRPTSHGNQSLTITYNSDSFADGPWASVVTHTGSVSESITLSDADVGSAVFSSSRSEALTLSESQTGGLLFIVSREEALALAAVEAVTRIVPATLTEALVLTESQAALAVFSVLQSETLALTDADSALAELQSALAEAMALVDSQDATLSGAPLEGAVTEAMVLVDVVSAQVVFVGSLSDGLALADASEGELLGEVIVSKNRLRFRRVGERTYILGRRQ